ncbi:ribosome maturation factor RimP [Caldicellulosiruptoraceae bacterium PP1]
MSKITKVVEAILLPILEKYNYELVDVEFKKEGKNHFLRVYIDKIGGITIDDCQIVSEELSTKLDELDPIPYSYFLEVSSPGLDRPLVKDRDFIRHEGELVEVKLKEPINNTKLLEGQLIKKDGDILNLRVNDQLIQIPMSKVTKVKVALKF